MEIWILMRLNKIILPILTFFFKLSFSTCTTNLAVDLQCIGKIISLSHDYNENSIPTSLHYLVLSYELGP